MEGFPHRAQWGAALPAGPVPHSGPVQVSGGGEWGLALGRSMGEELVQPALGARRNLNCSFCTDIDVELRWTAEGANKAERPLHSLPRVRHVCAMLCQVSAV